MNGLNNATAITDIRPLTFEEVDEVSGAIIPAIVGAIYAAQYVAAVYTASQIAFGAGVVVGGVATAVALTN